MDNIYINLIKWTILIFLLSILLKKYYSSIRGLFGEFWVKLELKKLSKKDYKIINNLLIKNSSEKTIQIDHVVISQYGIFVIEMKNYHGIIIGNEHSNYWLQVLRGKKSNFYNPIFQNYGHIKALSEVLNIPEEKFKSIICFSNECKLKVSSRTVVTYLDYLVKEIKKNNVNILSNHEIIYNQINSLNIADNKIRNQHINSIKDKVSKDNQKIEQMICPRCGNKLILRTGKYGSFYGCSSYPKCHYTYKTNNN